MSARLVRDNMDSVPWGDPEAKKYLRRVHTVAEHMNLLRRKLLEEAGEVITAPSKEDLAEELGDVLAVLIAYAAVHDVSWADVEAEFRIKLNRYGGFEHGMVWDTEGEQ